MDARYEFAIAPKPTWEWCVVGDWYAMTVRLPYKKGPCWFHRVAQRLLLGIHWRRCR